MKHIKFLSLLMALSFIFCLTGCEKGENVSQISTLQTDEEEVKMRDYLTLLYSATDSFNPYTLKTDVNRQLVKLLYEPLVKLNNEFEPINALAQQVSVNGNTCTVELKKAKMSDGSPLTAEDVVYSFNLAKASSTSYGAQLYGITSAKAQGDSVVFSLSNQDPYCANVLNFPIIKKDSDTKTDSDSVKLPPVGCGRFKLNDTLDGLVLNDGYYGTIKNIKEIRLINAPDTESVEHYTEIGAADIYFTEISDGNITRMSGSRQDVNLNNLVYIGINRNNAALKENNVRQALSLAVDRTKLCKDAYYNNALPATGFFHPAWKEAGSVQNLQIEAKMQITIENLEEIGYNKLDNDGIRKNSSGSSLKFTMLVNKENRIKVLAANTIAKQLKNAGIGITVVEKPYSEYIEDLQNGNFQLYLGEIRLSDNMDISPLFVSGGAAAYGLPKAEERDNSETEEESEPQVTSSEAVLKEFYSGGATIKDVASVLQTEMAAVPLCYRRGVLFYNSNIKNVNNSSANDIYFSIEAYLIN